MFIGLTSQDAQERLQKFGPNLQPKEKLPGFILIFLRQFFSPLIYILFAAAIISFFLSEASDACFIFIVLLINATIGATQEYSGQKSASELSALVPNFSIVLRDGIPISINSELIVPGDIVFLRAGDKVPADIQLMKQIILR